MENNSKIKIIHLITPYIFHTGSWIYSQLTGLEGCHSAVFTQKKENIDKFPFSPIFSAEDFPFSKKFVNKIYRRVTDQYGLFFDDIARTFRTDIFHAHFGYEAARWLDFAKRSRRPLVTTFYGMDVSKLGLVPEWQDRYSKLFEYGTVFLVEGTFLKRQLMQLGCQEDKIIIQHLGINHKVYPHKNYMTTNTHRPVIVLQVSTFREKKGIEYSLDAIARLRKSGVNVHFRLIGSGDTDEAEKRIRSIVDRLTLEEYVTFLGPQGHRETLREMSEADIFLHPSVTASDGDNEGGAPVGIIEASAVGLPVVSTLHADIPEVVIDGETGFLVAERNGELLAEKLENLISSPERRSMFGEAGRRHIARLYDLETQLQKQVDIYKRCLSQI